MSFFLPSNNFENEICPLLKFIAEYGNVTVYQWKTGKTPEKIDRKDAEISEGNIAEDAGEEVCPDFFILIF